MGRISRREFIGGATALGLSSLALPAFGQTGGPGRPNILIFFGDDMHGGMMSCAGNLHLDTPNMDFLAENGVCFTNAYTTYPLCSPSRAGIYSGLLPHQNGVMDNNQEYKKHLLPQVMGNVMSRAGYECHHGGKWHIGNRPRDDAAKIRECGFRPYTPMWRSPQLVNDAMRNHQGPEPFLAVIASHAPHGICQFKRHYKADKLPDDLPPPDECPPLPDNFGFGNDVPDAVMKWWKRRTEKYESYPKEIWRQYRWYYCRQVEELDAQLGQTLDALREGGQLENTMIIFTSDHGDGDASHQWQGKRVLYEKPIWVPLIISGPLVQRKGQVSDALVSNGLDIMPTVCDVGGAECPQGLPGGSLVPFLEREEPAWRDSVFCEVSGGRHIRGRTVRTKRYKYICYLGGEKQEQLFDLQEDSDEMHNLAYDADFADVLEKHRRLLLDWCRRTNDQRWLEGGWPGVG